MSYRSLIPGLLMLVSFLPNSECAARGFGGGGFHGGGGFGGGGFGGGAGGFHGGGNFGGGGFGGGGYGGGGRSDFGGGGFGGAGGFGGGYGGGSMNRGDFGGGGFGGAGGYGGAGRSNFGGTGQGGFGGLGQGGFGGQSFGGDHFGTGNFDRGNFAGGNFGAGNFGGGNFGAGVGRDSFGDRFNSTPSRNQLGSFLGLPSDEGMHSFGSGGAFDVNHGTATGPRGGTATGTSITGPGGNTYARGAAEGPNGGVVAGRGVEGANGGKAGQGVAVGPNGGVAAGGGVVGPNGGAAGRGVAVGPNGRVAGGRGVVGPNGGAAGGGFVAGPNGVAGGFARVSPSGRYVAAGAVRTNFNHYNFYGPGWYRNYPGAWFATGWAAGAAWNAATWSSVGAYCGYGDVQPIYYDYGNNVTYQDNSVYVNGQDVGTSQEYYDQAASLASTGTDADAPSDGDWLPLGVFALSKVGHPSSNLVVQLAVNKEGIIRGNYTDTVTNDTQVIHGAVDKQTQRVAFTVGDNKTTVVETGLYNLTKDEAPALMEFGQDRTEQWLLVRLKNNGDAAGDDAGAAEGAATSSDQAPSE